MLVLFTHFIKLPAGIVGGPIRLVGNGLTDLIHHIMILKVSCFAYFHYRRSTFVATLEANDDGGLNLPPELMRDAKPHAKFELEVLGDMLILRPAGKNQPFWQKATAQQRAEMFRQWAESPRPPTPDISLESLRRENMYD
ncbi:MAG: hypothetical protein ABSE63_08720 [Thermoguttaceae bacterium]